MKGKTTDLVNSKKIVHENENRNIDSFLRAENGNVYSEKWEKAKERFRRPAYYGVIQ